MSKKANFNLKQLRAIGHKLEPVVTVAGNGLSDTVVSEIDRALEQHELIKIKLAVGGREARAAVCHKLCEQTRAEVVQSIGNIVVVVRRAAQPDPKLSNLIRAL